MSSESLRFLDPESLQSVHRASLQILDEIGMIVDHAGALDVLEGAGAAVDRKTRVVRFPGDLVERCLALVPRAYTYHGRTPANDVTLTIDGDVWGRVPGGATGYIDLETGRQRRASIADWREMATLVDALPHIATVATLHCGDVPQATADLHSLRAIIDGQRKCVVHNAFTLANHRSIIEMAIAVRGSREALAERPIIHHQASPISPLYLNDDDVGQIYLAVEYGIPLDFPIMPISGVSAPITLAGTLAQANAEYLGTMTVVQTRRPGHPMAYFMDPVAADMRTGISVMGSPEIGLLISAISQLGTEFYGLPTQTLSLAADGFSLGQHMHQKTQHAMLATLSGTRLMAGAGCVESVMALSPMQLVIDDELVATARRWRGGFRVNADSLALEALAGVGPRGDFLADDHTLAHLRTGEHLALALSERESRPVWEATGMRTLESRARDKARAILEEHEVEPLPSDVRRELDRIVEHADARARA